MQIEILPVTVTAEDGSSVVTTTANAYLAVSNSIAIRVVPVDSAGTEYPDATIGIVGPPTQPGLAEAYDGFTTIVQALVAAYGA